MRVLIAFDKFKDALSAAQACDIAGREIRARRPDWILDLCPLADGGDGFCEVLTRAAQGELLPVQVMGPRERLVPANIGWVDLSRLSAELLELLGVAERHGRLALIEMAQSSGLALLRPEERDPWLCTSYGTGQLIRASAEAGARAVLLGVGGSATHDLGLGALAALGFEFRGAENEKIRPPVPSRWERIRHLEGALYPSIPPIRIACDVSNPLLGPDGSAAVYAPQKGLLPQDYPRLEQATERMARLLCAHAGRPFSDSALPGTGAAGGIAFGLMVAARAALVPGFDLIARWLRLEERIRQADIVITGEGRFDQSSLSGKGPGSLVRRALRLDKQIHVFAGSIGALTDLPSTSAKDSLLRITPITPADSPLERALAEAAGNLACAVTKCF